MANQPAIRAFEAKRVRYETARSFDEVMSRLRALVGDASDFAARKKIDGGGTLEDFQNRVKALAGESDFMLFAEIDHGGWLEHYGVRRKVVRWIFGNPVIAYTMMRHDIGAGLFAPVEILLFENESGAGSTIIYDLPSSLMVLDDNPPLLSAATELDRKMAALIERVTAT